MLTQKCIFNKPIHLVICYLVQIGDEYQGNTHVRAMLSVFYEACLPKTLPLILTTISTTITAQISTTDLCSTNRSAVTALQGMKACMRVKRCYSCHEAV